MFEDLNRTIDADLAVETPAEHCSACNQPCTVCDDYKWCVRESLHDGYHQCDRGHFF